MARYCFNEEEGRKALFEEVCLRAFLVAVLDWPGQKSDEECTLCIIHECDHLRGDVSGVEDDTQYQHLIETAWIEIYRTTPQLPERDLAYVKGILAYVPTEDAKAIIRLGWNEAAVKEAWMQYCTLAR